MLKRAPKSSFEYVESLAAAEDQALRRAFGRFANETNRSNGAAIVRRYHYL